MPKRDRNHKCLPPRNQIRLINKQIHISTRIPRKPSQNRCEPGCLQGIHRQGCLKKAEKSFLFRLLTGNNKRQTRGDLIDAKGFRNTDRYQDEQQVPKKSVFSDRVCKVFDTKFGTAFSKAFHIALRWSARSVSVFSIDILLRWSKETSLEIKTSSRQRRDMSIEINISRRCTPAECYVLTRDRSGKTLL